MQNTEELWNALLQDTVEVSIYTESKELDKFIEKKQLRKAKQKKPHQHSQQRATEYDDKNFWPKKSSNWKQLSTERALRENGTAHQLQPPVFPWAFSVGHSLR